MRYALLLLLLLLVSCHSNQIAQAQQKPQAVSLIYSANLDGELEPCGCSEQGDLGGLKRRAQLLDDLRKAQANLVVVSGGGLLTSEGASDRVKSEFILEGFKALNYDAIALQWKDLAYGADFLKSQPLAWVNSNWIGEQFNSQVDISRNDGALHIHVYSWLDPADSPTRQMAGQHALVGEGSARIVERLRKSRHDGALTLLMVDKPLEEISKHFDLNLVDLLLVKSRYEEFSQPKLVGNTWVLQAGSRGMRLGRLDFEFDSQAKKSRIVNLKSQILPMPKSIADAPRMLDWYQRYNDKVKADYLKRVEIRKQQESGVSPYAGVESCQTCHAKQYQIWSESEHAKAFDDLENVGKSFDPNCIVCHSVGFDKAGGFFDAMLTSDLAAVQCENCHGAAKAHVDSKGAKPVANKAWTRQKMCAQCHTQPHSPAFDEAKYWPKIAH